MQGGVVSSDGWVNVSDFEKLFELERPVQYLKIYWTSDSLTNGYISIYLNNNSSPVFPAILNASGTDKGCAGFEFEVKDIPIYNFKIKFSENNPKRNINYYGYY